MIIIGAGPCGLSAAIECQNLGMNPLLIEKENIVSSISHYPTHQRFFSSSDRLEIGGIPFPSVERKPKRAEALAYYREVSQRKHLRINAYEKVTKVIRTEQGEFELFTADPHNNIAAYSCSYLILATGYYNHPNKLHVEGEELPHVFHYFKEAHPYFQKNVVVIGGKNSAVDATLELEKAGANVTVLYRGEDISDDVKPWILPEFRSLERKKNIQVRYDAEVTAINEHYVYFQSGEAHEKVQADFVFAMTGYHPDHAMLQRIGVQVDEKTGRPYVEDTTMETNITNIYIAGVLAAGNNANEIFIENGRHHGERIAASIKQKALLSHRDE